jgi:hypothetical protein
MLSTLSEKGGRVYLVTIYLESPQASRLSAQRILSHCKGKVSDTGMSHLSAI